MYSLYISAGRPFFYNLKDGSQEIMRKRGDIVRPNAKSILR